jgi:ATP-dependent RNA helicase DeaD
LDRLKEEIDEETIIFKLISMVLDKNKIQGPNHIGIPKDKLSAILQKAQNRKEKRNSFSRQRNSKRERNSRHSRKDGQRKRNSSMHKN